MITKLIIWLVDWLADWLIDLSTGWMIYWLIALGNPEDKVCGCQSLGNLTSLEIIRGVIVDQKLGNIFKGFFVD